METFRVLVTLLGIWQGLIRRQNGCCGINYNLFHFPAVTSRQCPIFYLCWSLVGVLQKVTKCAVRFWSSKEEIHSATISITNTHRRNITFRKNRKLPYQAPHFWHLPRERRRKRLLEFMLVVGYRTKKRRGRGISYF